MFDEHCHIIWGVDDGAQTQAESLAMLDAAARVGVTRMVATPHMRWGDFSQERVEGRFEELAADARERGIALELGYEVYFPQLAKMGFDEARRFVRRGTDELLVEYNSGGALPFGWEQQFFELMGTHDLAITVAHPERYRDVLDDIDVVYRMKELGCRIQVSAGDLLRGRFDHVARCAKKLLDEGLVDAIVSDAHRPEHYDDFSFAMRKWGERL